MNIDHLQAELDHWDKSPYNRVTGVATIVKAARLVANPNIEAAHRAMRALMPREWEREPFPKAFAEIIIEAALTPQEDE